MIYEVTIWACAQFGALRVSERLTLLTLAILGLLGPDNGFVPREVLIRATGLSKRQLIRIIQKLESENLIFRDDRKAGDRGYYGWARFRAGYFQPAPEAAHLGADDTAAQAPG
jgi:hypothetical protein